MAAFESKMRNPCSCGDYCEWCSPELTAALGAPTAVAPAEVPEVKFEFRVGQAVETPGGPATVLQNAMRYEDIHAMGHELVPHVKVEFVLGGGCEWFATYEVYDIHDACFDPDLQGGK